jgi:hypothetical protein
MGNKTKNIHVQNVDAASWKQFRGRALINGYDSGADWLRHLISVHAKGENEE